jgi:ferredoxin
MMFRSKKLLDAARDQDCTIQIPGVCNRDKSTVVGCHANWLEYGKGGAMKAHDCYIAFGCSACHFAIDQGTKLSYEEKKEYWRQGFERTILVLFTRGILKVVGAK